MGLPGCRGTAQEQAIRTRGMKEEYILDDRELGRMRVSANPRARRFTFRCKDGALTCTVPPHTLAREVARAVEQMRPSLRRLLERGRCRSESALFTPGSRIDADSFTFRCIQADALKPGVREDAGGMTFLYPPGTDWASPHLQHWLTAAVEECLRRRARRLLLPRLAQLAKERGLTYSRASVRKTRSRWGSCSAQGSISLSIYLMLLPPTLRDYIMHHELTHLLEMNHGPRFHALLNQAVGGRSAELRQELRHHRTALCLQ